MRILKNWFVLISISFLCLGVVCTSAYIIPLLLKPSPLPLEEAAEPSWAPNGQKLAYVCYLEGPTQGKSQLEIIFSFDFDNPTPVAPWSEYTNEAADICTIDIDGQNRRRLTEELGPEWGPVWSPDGTKIAYYLAGGKIYVTNSDESNYRQLAAASKVSDDSLSWSSDGNHLLFSACLDSSNYDIYSTDIRNGVITNLTPDSHKHDIAPRWILNNTKIFFLSTSSSTFEGSSGSGVCNLKHDAPHQMKVINSDGSEEKKIYQELYYPFVAVSNTGDVAFVSDMISKTKKEYWDINYSNHPAYLYQMNLDNPEPTKVPTEDSLADSFQPIVISWSPDGKKLLYIDRDRRPKVLYLENREVVELPSLKPFFNGELFQLEDFNWSPDSQQIAATVSRIENVDKYGGLAYSYTLQSIYFFDLREGTVHPLEER